MTRAVKHPVLSASEPSQCSDRYNAAFAEDDNGARIEFMHKPPRATD